MAVVGGGRQFLVGDDAHDHVRHRLAHRTGPGQPLVGRDHRHHSTLGGAVVLGHLRAPPLDHLALHRGRARGRAVQHQLQRLAAEGGLARLVDAQQAHELGGHEVHIGDGMPVDELEGLLGHEPALHHDRRPTDEREERERPLRRVVVRPAQQRAPMRREADVHHASGHELVHLGRHPSGERGVAHALGPTGGARGVEHHPAHGLLGRFVGARCGQGCLVVGAERQHRYLHPGGVGCVLGVDHQQHGAGVLDDVLDLVGSEVPVDGHHLDARVGHRHQHLEHLAPVARQQRDALAGLHAGRTQMVHEPVHPLVEFGPRGGAVVVDERRFGPLRRVGSQQGGEECRHTAMLLSARRPLNGRCGATRADPPHRPRRAGHGRPTAPA